MNQINNFVDIKTFELIGSEVGVTYRGPDVNAGRDVFALINGRRHVMSYTNVRVRTKLYQIDRYFETGKNKEKAVRYFEDLIKNGYVFSETK